MSGSQYDSTANFALKKPWVEADDDLWGEHWNQNADAIDALLRTVQVAVSISDAPPANPVKGQLWFDSSNPQLYVWYDDGNSVQWVIAVAYAGGLTSDAPSDGTVYGRQNGAWHGVPWNAGTVGAIGANLALTGGTLDVASSVTLAGIVNAGSVVTSNINALSAAPGSGLSGGNIILTTGARDGTTGFDGGITFANGGTTGGNTTSLTHFQVGSFAASRFITTTGPAGTNRTMRFATSIDAFTSNLRWQLMANGTAEGGSNAGSDLDFYNYSDAGAALTNPLIRITRATGVTAISAPVSAPFHATGVTNNVGMTGTTQATAKLLTQGLNIITGGLSLSNNGVVLPPIGAATVVGAVPVGTKVDIFNTVTFTAHVYANGTQAIDAAPAATGVSLSAGARCSYFANSGSTWVSALMGGVSA